MILQPTSTNSLGKASDEFIANLMAVCALIASFPGVGKTDHDYATYLAGFPFKHNWIFYEADHFGLFTRIGENPDRLVALSGVLPIFLGPVHLTPYPVKIGTLIAFKHDEATSWLVVTQL